MTALNFLYRMPSGLFLTISDFHAISVFLFIHRVLLGSFFMRSCICHRSTKEAEQREEDEKKIRFRWDLSLNIFQYVRRTQTNKCCYSVFQFSIVVYRRLFGETDWIKATVAGVHFLFFARCHTMKIYSKSFVRISFDGNVSAALLPAININTSVIYNT